MNIAILGLGTIGSGVYELLKDNREITVKKILDIRVWMDNMTTEIDDIVNDESIELVVETMGGIHPAREYALKCLEAGKSYVSANKLLISACAFELQQAADKSRAALLFSASCGGGIPYLYNLQKTKAADRVVSLGGILNGTTNFILDSVFSDGMDYESALKTAQELGYAERDPSSDIDGLDTLRKLLLSCAVAYGKLPKEETVPCYGIRGLNDTDVCYAKSKNCVIRLTASGKPGANGTLNVYVAPQLLPCGSPESSIRKNINYAWYEGEKIGRFTFSGQGAGKFPTAGNIIRDIYSVYRGEKRMFPEDLVSEEAVNSDKHRFYVRMPENEINRLSAFSAHTEIKNGCTLTETVPISFGELRSAIDGAGDTFVMILED